MGNMRRLTLLGLACTLASGVLAHADDEPEAPWERGRREAQDAEGGVPAPILARQSLAKVRVPTHAAAAARALEAADAEARQRIDGAWHTGRRLLVPDAYATIQAAIDAAQARDVVVVRAGTYYELLVMKDGVKLVSDDAEGGNEAVPVKGASLRLPRRALRTILDGSKGRPSRHGMIDFTPGTGAHTIVDGFTIQKLPRQNHHVPGHAHGLNVRGASPVIMHCLIRDNGSTGLGNHVVYRDQDKAIAERDFRVANVEHEARAVIYRNIVHGNLGRGIGCNHLSAPWILGNEVFGNDDSELGEAPGPGVGLKHGAAPVIVGNLVHHNPGGGIMGRVGAKQGLHPIDRPPGPVILHNVVYANGKKRPAISCAGGGTAKVPVEIRHNVVLGAGAVGIGLVQGTFGVVEDNVVTATGLGGISIAASTVLRLLRNGVTKAGGPGFTIVDGARVLQMEGNAADANTGPRFLLHEATITAP